MVLAADGEFQHLILMSVDLITAPFQNIRKSTWLALSIY